MSKRRQDAGSFFEVFLIYYLLFFSGTLGGAVSLAFSPIQELHRIFGFRLPALALIWYLLLKAPALSSFKEKRRFLQTSLMPKGADGRAFIIGLPLLFLSAFSVSFLFHRLLQLPPEGGFASPGELSGWLAAILSCFCTAYLEESYFRFYLFKKTEDAGVPESSFVFISASLFALCHLYEGTAGAVNAFLAGLILALIFARTKALHGIAWAHGLYNVLVYVLNRG
ncbi:MAG: CPBP family intramembrane metalloprotease [Treponema sp.]|jgi:membrane protease YdiL (CAAX protease family)|nr:CPBP family intramembrane metalloprotease [Treponema sp.]